MGKLFDLPWGWVESYDDNELAIVSTIKDPPKIRLAVDADKVESNLGAVSFNLRRSDGRHEEYAVVMGRLTADRRGGALYLAVRPPGDESVREIAYFDSGAVVFRAPISAPNLSGSSRPSGFTSDDGAYIYNVQGDPTPQFPHGRIVQYRRNGSDDPVNWTPVAILRPEPL
jgi:hypothetical protein